MPGEGNDDPATGDRWNWTLGQDQYDWLKQTLENSDAKYKFLFSHQLLGGTQAYVRGGAVPAPWFEWGGYTVNASNTNEIWEFDTKRPGMPETIRQILIDNNVSATFRGHDHQFVYEKRDGIVYQLLPSPCMGSSYGFDLYDDSPWVQPGGNLPNSGYLRCTVSPTQTLVQYISTSTGNEVYAYTIDPITTPEPTISIIGTPLADFYSNSGSPSEEQSYTVSGSDLMDDITITAPSDFEISENSGSGFGSSITLNQSGGSVVETTIYVRFNRANAGTSSGDITHTSSGATQQDVAVSGTAYSDPTIVITGTPLNDFTGETGSPSDEQSYSVSGYNLGGDIIITAPTDFEISENSGSGFTSLITLVQSGGTVSETTIFVRFNRSSAGSSNGNITHASSGATQQDVAVSGTATDPPDINFISEIGSANIKDSGQDDLVITTTTAVSEGDDIMIGYVSDPNASVVINITDAVGNTYNEIALSINYGQLRTYLFAAYNVSALPSGSAITITQSEGTPAARAAVAAVFRGIVGIDLLDQTSTGDGSGTSPSSGLTATTMDANELIIGVIGTEGPAGDAEGTWSNSFSTGARHGSSGSTDDTNVSVALGYYVASSTGTFAAEKTGITSRDWSAVVATFTVDAINYDEIYSDYNSDSGFSATVSHPDGDQFTATATSGTISSIHVYRVDGNPLASATVNPASATVDANRYWGVRIYGSDTPTYSVVYNYDGHLGISNELDLDLVLRSGPLDNTWEQALGTLDENNNTVTLTGQTGTEYALASMNGDNSLPVELVNFSAIGGDAKVKLQWSTGIRSK